MPLLGLTLAAVVAEGYHFGSDDAEVYLAAVKQAADPALYPFGAEFFLAQTRLSVFAPLVGGSARLLHLPVACAVLIWYLLTVYGLLFAAWRVAAQLFADERARWGAVALVAALLPAPVAGTALIPADNYLTARSFSTPLALLAVDAALGRRWWTALGLLGATALFHPLMAIYAGALVLLLAAPKISTWLHRAGPAVRRSAALRSRWIAAGLIAGSFIAAVLLWHRLGFALDGFSLRPAEGVYREVLYSRTYFFPSLWAPYEWLGVIGPMLLLAALVRWPPRSASSRLIPLCRTLIVLGGLATVSFLILGSRPVLESLTRLQPMRAFQLITLLLFVILGGLLGEYVLKGSVWRWAALFLPLALIMALADHAQYPHSAHLELPGQSPANPWLAAFAWIRANTPRDAVFAMDPNLMALPAEDRHGFRALAERSALADHYKDSGPVTMFPALLPEWQREQELVQGWQGFGPEDFHRLAADSTVHWVVLDRSRTQVDRSLNCPYRNPSVAVCRIAP